MVEFNIKVESLFVNSLDNKCTGRPTCPLCISLIIDIVSDEVYFYCNDFNFNKLSSLYHTLVI